MNEIRYLNVDLLIKSRDDLSPVVNNFGEDVLVLHNGKAGEYFSAYLETAQSLADPNEDIVHFCMLIEALPPVERQIWDNCFHKIFDLGYSCGASNRSFSSDLRTDTIEKIAKYGASLRVTIYPP